MIKSASSIPRTTISNPVVLFIMTGRRGLIEMVSSMGEVSTQRGTDFSKGQTLQQISSVSIEKHSTFYDIIDMPGHLSYISFSKRKPFHDTYRERKHWPGHR
jgi:hypothetical protein